MENFIERQNIAHYIDKPTALENRRSRLLTFQLEIGQVPQYCVQSFSGLVQSYAALRQNLAGLAG